MEGVKISPLRKKFADPDALVETDTRPWYGEGEG